MQQTTQYPPSVPSVAKESGSLLINFDSLIPSMLFLASLVFFLPFLRYSALEPDEGILLQGAQRILEGQVPYRDFFTFYTPGSFYLVAGLFRVFGDSFAVARFSIATVGAFLPVVTYVLTRRLCSRSTALLLALLTVAGGTAYRFLVLHNWYSTLLACLALYSAVRWLESHRGLWAVATGSLCSLTVLFEQSKGAGICVGLILGFWTLRIIQRKQTFQAREFAAVGLGFAWPVLLVLGYFGAQHSLTIMFEDCLWPVRHYGIANHVPYGYQNWSDHSRELIFHTGPAWAIAIKVLIITPGFILPALPWLAVGTYVHCLASRLRSEPTTKSHYVLISSALIGLLLSVIASRADIIHFMYLLPLWLIPLAWILDQSKARTAWVVNSRVMFIFFLAVSFGLMALALLSTAAGAHNGIMTRRGAIKTNQKDDVIPFVQAHVAGDGKVLVYPYLPLYYYLTATNSVARLDYFQPGMNTPEQADEILDSLHSHPESPVLFEPGFVQKIGTSWPRTPMKAIADDPIGHYIAINYRVCQLLKSPSDSFEFMVRRERACP